MIEQNWLSSYRCAALSISLYPYDVVKLPAPAPCKKRPLRIHNAVKLESPRERV